MRSSVEIYLIYHIDKCLRIIPKEIANHSDMVAIGEDGCYERRALMRGKGVVDQLFQSWNVTACDHTVKQTGLQSPE